MTTFHACRRHRALALLLLTPVGTACDDDRGHDATSETTGASTGAEASTTGDDEPNPTTGASTSPETTSPETTSPDATTDASATDDGDSSDEETDGERACGELGLAGEACVSCVERSCCAEVGACQGDAACMDCLFDPTASCDEAQLAAAGVARACMFDACRAECGMTDAACTDTPADSCVLPEGLACDPFTNAGCAEDEICALGFADGGPPSASCYAPGVELDEPCGACIGNCPAGFVCNGPSTSPDLWACSELCCSDADCSPGSVCDPGAFEFLFGVPSLGMCRVSEPPAAGDACEAAIRVDLGVVAGDTTDAPAGLDPSCAGVGGREIVYVVSPDETGTLQITLDPGWGFAVDPVLHVRTTCSDVATEIGCTDVPGEPHRDELLELQVTAGTDYYIVVDSSSAYAYGPFELTLTML